MCASQALVKNSQNVCVGTLKRRPDPASGTLASKFTADAKPNTTTLITVLVSVRTKTKNAVHCELQKVDVCSTQDLKNILLRRDNWGTNLALPPRKHTTARGDVQAELAWNPNATAVHGCPKTENREVALTSFLTFTCESIKIGVNNTTTRCH